MEAFLQKIRVKDDTHHGYATTKWLNPDITPLPPHRRTWGIVTYLGFGSISNLCISAWAGGASLISLGLTIPQTIGVMIVARCIIFTLVIANGWLGAEWHIGFTVSQRVVLGMYGAYIGQVIRILLSIVWYGSQSWLGGLCVSTMISSWSHDFLTMKNTLPESAKMVTRDFIGFVLFHIISVPFLLLRVEKIKVHIIVANIIALCVMLSIVIWATSTAGGVGPLFAPGAKGETTLPPGWSWPYGIIASLGGISAGILNQSDFTRFTRKQGVQVPGLMFSIFVPGMLVPMFGIITASCTMKIYGGSPFWNPLVLIQQWMITNYTAGARAAAFFASLGFIISQLAENILGNGYAAGMDLAGLFPSYISIRRGGLIAALLSWAVQPWLFYNSSSVFLTVASSFSVFMGPLTGIMIADYFIIRKQKIEISQLYTGSPEGSYWYFYGFNWRAIISWVVGFAPAMPGMIHAANPSVHVSDGIYKYYLGNYLFGFTMAATLYTALCFFFKVKRAGMQDEHDMYGTFSEDVAIKKGIAPFEGPKVIDDVEVAGEGQELSEGNARSSKDDRPVAV